LFTDPETLKERATRKFYRLIFGTKKRAELASSNEVQAFLDDEHAEVTYDPKYHGAYDERPIFPGDVGELNQLVDTEPWDADRIRRVHERLYRELGRHVEDLADVRKRIRNVNRRTFGRPRGRDRSRLIELEDQQAELFEWFASFDRRVYLVHAHMTKAVGEDALRELTHRYEFHLDVQAIHQAIAQAQEQVADILEGLDHYGEDVPDGFVEELMDTFRSARGVLRRCIDDARQMRTPEMANIGKGTRFDGLIFEGQLVRDLPETFIKGTWIAKFVAQLDRTRHRVNRMDYKSLGAILQMQDRLAAEWLAKQPRATEPPLPELIVLDDVPPNKPEVGPRS
jgi:hypothetical protein